MLDKEHEVQGQRLPRWEPRQAFGSAIRTIVGATAAEGVLFVSRRIAESLVVNSAVAADPRAQADVGNFFLTNPGATPFTVAVGLVSSTTVFLDEGRYGRKPQNRRETVIQTVADASSFLWPHALLLVWANTQNHLRDHSPITALTLLHAAVGSVGLFRFLRAGIRLTVLDTQRRYHDWKEDRDKRHAAHKEWLQSPEVIETRLLSMPSRRLADTHAHLRRAAIQIEMDRIAQITEKAGLPAFVISHSAVVREKLTSPRGNDARHDLPPFLEKRK